MYRRPTPSLCRLRRRSWRLAALWLWAAVLVVNLAAALGQPAAAGTLDAKSLAGDLRASLCHAGDASGAPAAADESGDTRHCALCFVFAAGIIATPGATPVAVLDPVNHRAPLLPALAAPPGTAPPAGQSQPRAPPASPV